MSHFCRDEEEQVQLIIADSLKRQIEESKKQLKDLKQTQCTQLLEFKTKLDKKKAFAVLRTLKVQKQLHDYKKFLEESRKQWELDFQHSLNSLHHYSVYLKKERLIKSKCLNELHQVLASVVKTTKLKAFFEEETTGMAREDTSKNFEEETTLKDSSQERLLSYHLKAAIENSYKRNHSETLKNRLERIKNNVKHYAAKKALQHRTLVLDQSKEVSFSTPYEESSQTLQKPLSESPENILLEEFSSIESNQMSQSLSISPIRLQVQNESSEMCFEEEIQDLRVPDFSVHSQIGIFNQSGSKHNQHSNSLNSVRRFVEPSANKPQKSFWKKLCCCFKSKS